jgi:hypothetical protein
MVSILVLLPLFPVQHHTTGAGPCCCFPKHYLAAHCVPRPPDHLHLPFCSCQPTCIRSIELGSHCLLKTEVGAELKKCSEV